MACPEEFHRQGTRAVSRSLCLPVRRSYWPRLPPPSCLDGSNGRTPTGLVATHLARCTRTFFRARKTRRRNGVRSGYCGRASQCATRPMLAKRGKLPTRGAWTYEVKWDGFRAVVSTEGSLRVPQPARVEWRSSQGERVPLGRRDPGWHSARDNPLGAGRAGSGLTLRAPICPMQFRATVISPQTAQTAVAVTCPGHGLPCSAMTFQPLSMRLPLPS
jgi:hypothetical protein